MKSGCLSSSRRLARSRWHHHPRHSRASASLAHYIHSGSVVNYIIGRAIVAATARHIVVADRSARVDISLDADFSPEILCEKLRRGIHEFAELVGEEDAALTGCLASAGLVSASPTEHVRLPGTICQAHALLGGGGHLASGIVIYTADEAFWPGSDPDLARLAFRVFVSRPASIVRCAIYAPLAAGFDICVAGDEPAAPALERARHVLDEAEGPCVIDFESGLVTGRALSVSDVWSGRAGRLSITACGPEHFWEMASGAVITWVSGVSTFPNLTALPELENTAAYETLDYPRVSGVDADPEMAFIKCQAEGAERFAAGDVRPEALHYCAASGLNGRWLAPHDVVSYSTAQRNRLSLSEFDPDHREWWVRGETHTGPIWIPAALVFYPFMQPPHWLGESAVSSSGVAAYVTLEGAISRAWLELVERDAFQRARFTGPSNPPASVCLSTLSGSPREIVERIAEQAVVRVLVLESPTRIPVGLVRADTDKSLAIGMAASDELAECITKAATEALLQITSPFMHEIEEEAVRTPGDHAALYNSPGWRDKLDWMRSGPSIDFAEVEANHRHQIGSRACWYELPSGGPDLHVVRVIDPDLIPLTFGYDTDLTGRSDVRALLRMSDLDDAHPLEPHPIA